VKSQEIREKFLNFFKKRNHLIIEEASIIPEDSTTLFTTAGMQQFKRYYIEPRQAPSLRIATIQPCLRTDDLNEIGDETHLTFFEMLGNFSFGYPNKNAYFKQEAIEWAWEFLTKELKIPKNRITASYFKGEKEIPADLESLKILKHLSGLTQIRGKNLDENFWSLGSEGSPAGPTVEFFVDGMEVWNLVFNEYILQQAKPKPNKTKGVDTGMGFERLVKVLQNQNDLYKTDLFQPIIRTLEQVSGKKYINHCREFRIIADHLKAAVFAVYEGVHPSNKEQGYVVRRLIRRATLLLHQLKVSDEWITRVVESILKIYAEPKPKIYAHKNFIINEIDQETKQFSKTISLGLKMFQKIAKKREISALELFNLYQTFGFPLELSLEIAKEKGLKVPVSAKEEFQKELLRHQEISRAGQKKFKGGLITKQPETIKLHTATHLLHAALRQILGEHVKQCGSNISPERLRFDFSHPEKLTQDQIKKIETLVNQQIKRNLPVVMEEMPLPKALKSGALGVFKEKYSPVVKVYSIGDFSKEICGGPHVGSTGQLGRFKIIKEQSSKAGVRRIKAVLE